MAQNAYCNECGTRVPLTETGLCLYGHPRSALRDVREGDILPKGAPVSRASDSDAGAPAPTKSQATASAIVGKLVVIVPAIVVVVVGLWSGYAAGVGLGQSKVAAWLSSIGSMLLMGVIVALLVWDRRRKMNR